MAKQILIIDSDNEHAGALKTYIERQQYEVIIATTFDEVRQHLAYLSWDIILADPFLSEDMAACLYSAKKKNFLVQIIILAQKDKLETAMDLLGSSAIHYLEVPVNSKALDLALIAAGKNISLNMKIKRYSETLADFHNTQDLL
ncbi:MAG: histidine kinase, partial [Desulfobacteraceae bacterium]|nr:histidine kinase [Desulfobacteraceae bacterium]